MTAFLEARAAGKWFGAGKGAVVRALDGVSLEVPRGAFVVVTGPSGSGKTTLLALLGTLERPTHGAVLVDGADAASLSEASRSRVRRRFGFAFPGGPMIAGLPLWENVTLGLVPLGAGADERRGVAAEALDRVGLAERLRARPEELSTGELNRAALARALAARPEALLLDEPAANLDAAARGRVVAALDEAHRGGATLVVATHQPGDFPSATALVRLDAGRLVPP